MTEDRKENRILINLEIGFFRIPPCNDVLVIGRKAAMGKHSALKMLDSVSPDVFELIELDHPVIEAMVVKKDLLKMLGKDRLSKALIEELSPLMEHTTILNVCIDLKLLRTISMEIRDANSG